MKKLQWWEKCGIAGAVTITAGFLACGAGSTPFMPDTGTVTSKTDNGGHGWPIHVCVRSDSGGEPVCENYRRADVKNCKVGSRWPECKEKS